MAISWIVSKVGELIKSIISVRKGGIIEKG
jgi:hypothetical protein